MARVLYSRELCSELIASVRDAALAAPYQPTRYDAGDVLDLRITGAWPETDGRARLTVDRFVGGGFAGQVYRCRLDALDLEPGAPGLETGRTVAVKMMIPPTRFSRAFRNLLYWIGFQAPFSAATNRAACRAGLLWQKLARVAAGKVFGTEDAVADVYATFYDPDLKAFGEIREWVEGRTWRLEPDLNPRARRHWRTVEPLRTGSPEYVAKRQFMARFVDMLHAMGAPELARQYEWWTMKSQPNALKRAEAGPGPGDGLCAVDFRAGLVLLPFLPMSPADCRLIVEGARRGALVQFDRFDPDTLHAFAREHTDVFGAYDGLVEAICAYDAEYRRSMPDLTHQGLRLLRDADLRAAVRAGLADAYAHAGAIDRTFAASIAGRPAAFCGFQALMLLPGAGPFARRLWGNAGVREHWRRLLADAAYRRKAWRAGAARRLVDWHRAGRAGESRTRFLARHPGLFWLERLTLGLIPWPGLHRAVAEPRAVAARIAAGWRFIRNFYTDAGFRERWLADGVEAGFRDGMLSEAERDEILARIRDPFIIKYLKSLAVHFATLPVTQIVSLTVGAVVYGWTVARGGSHLEGAGWFFLTLGAFQVTPISPGSICRGLYVVYLMIRERNYKDYLVAAPVSFLKYIGYLAFPLQMATAYPSLSRYMASRRATDAVHIVPVFGEKGALLEHWVFDAFFNAPRRLGRWVAPRIRGILDVWLAGGLALLAAALGPLGVEWNTKTGINLILAVVVLFVLPRVLFYPVLSRRGEADPSP